MPEETNPSRRSAEDGGVGRDSSGDGAEVVSTGVVDPETEPSAEESAPPAGEASGQPSDRVSDAGPGQRDGDVPPNGDGMARRTGRFVKELVIIVVIALVASALLRAFVVQAFYVPSGSMLPEIQLQDRILVSRIGDVKRGEVVVFEDPGGWIPKGEQAAPPGPVRKAFEFVGVLPASGHEHLVKRAIGLPGDHVICCTKGGDLTINGQAVDESDFIAPGKHGADNTPFDVIVPKDHIFVLGDNRYVSGDSSRHLDGQEAFIPMDLVTGRAFAVIWPFDHRHILHVPDAYDDVPDGQTPPEKGVINPVSPGGER